MKYIHSSENEIYTAPILANGRISLTIAPDGSMNPDSSGKLIKNNIGRAIFRAGKRHKSLPSKPLIHFGRFTQELAGDKEILPLVSEQTLDPDRAEILCDTEYDDGSKVKTIAFVDPERELLIVRKSFVPASEFVYRFSYKLCDANGNPVRFMKSDADDDRIVWEALDQTNCKGGILVFTDAPDAVISHKSDEITISVSVKKPIKAAFYILFTDLSVGGKEEILAEGFENLRARHAGFWKEFHDKGFARTGDESLDRAYKTALYHLKSYATDYSMPVGLNNSAWESRFFAFDEHYMFDGLISSNHIDEAKRVPVFRKNGLGIATRRASSAGKHAARYPWETLEDGTEASPAGFWFDHIFHMSMITLSEYEYYLYTLDKEFLRVTAYPVIEASAEFFVTHSLYRVGDRLIVGKCTDLERLGSAVDNPYMTTCGVVSTLRVFSASSRILGVNSELADEYERIADELLESLPRDEKRYLPSPGCEARSISAFSGTYPFDVIDRGDRFQTNAIDDYLGNEDIFGNMYSVGRGVCSWYACWKSIVFTRLSRRKESFDALSYVARTAGDFGEMFEINNRESGAYYHPWFTTAAGILVYAVNELLAREDEKGRIAIASGLDETRGDFDFRIAVPGGLVVTARAGDGKLEKLVLTKNAFREAGDVTLTIPERFIEGTEFESSVIGRENGTAVIVVSL